MSHRIKVTLTDGQYARLRRESERTGIALPALVRRAVDSALPDPEQALKASFGAWTDRDFRGDEYVDRPRPGMGKRLVRVQVLGALDESGK